MAQPTLPPPGSGALGDDAGSSPGARPRTGSWGTPCLSLTPQTLLLVKISVSISLGLFASLVKTFKKPETQGKPSEGRVKATLSCPLSVRSQPFSVPLGRRLRCSSEPVKITSLGAGRNTGSPTARVYRLDCCTYYINEQELELGKGCPWKPCPS